MSTVITKDSPSMTIELYYLGSGDKSMGDTHRLVGAQMI